MVPISRVACGLGGDVLVGIVMVAVAMGVVFLHVVVFRLLDDLIGVPLTLGVFALVYVAVWLFVYREEIRFTLFPRRSAHRMVGSRPTAPIQPPRIALWSAKMVDEAATKYEKSEEPALAQAAGLLRIVRHALHDALSENVGDQHRCRILEEHYGMVPVVISRPNEDLPYLYVHRYVEEGSGGYPPVTHVRRETLAHAWKIESDLHGRGEVVLTIGDDRKPRLMLKPEFRRFPATRAGWRQLAAYLSSPG
jgi:hypothetical protein